MDIFSTVVMYFMNFWGSKKVQEIANELLTLEYQDFDGLTKSNCPKFNRYVIQKSITLMGQLVSLFILNYGLPGNRPYTIQIIITCLIQLGMSLISIQYYTIVLFIYRYVWTINGQLEELADQLNKNPLTNSSRIRELLSLYQRLLMLSKKLVATYELQMTMTLTVGLAGNIVIIYFLIVFGTSMDSTFMVLSYCVLINIWDFWLNIVVCELTEEAGRNTSTVLKRFTDLKQKDVELERNVCI